MKTNFRPSRILFYILSFTWGIILSTLGLVASLALRALGPYSFVCPDAPPELLTHEAGHSYQNALFGPIAILLTLVSIIHYWISCFVPKVQNDYYNFWTEKNATKLGESMRNVIKNH